MKGIVMTTTALSCHQPAALAIDFSTASLSKLSDLLAAFDAAERELGLACIEDDKFPSTREHVKIFGGAIPATTLVIEGRPTERIEASEWFYRSRDEIERQYAVRRAEATTVEDSDAVEQRFAELRAECDRQLKEIARNIPRGKKKAERRLKAAHRTVAAVERKILNYKPADLNEAVTLLEYTSGGKRRTCFSTDEEDLHTIMLNVAGVIKRELAS
jgi:hypothetical protein